MLGCNVAGMELFLSLWIKLFFVLTPFFAMTMFLSLSEGYPKARRRRLALTVTAAVAVICLILFFVGRQMFTVFGITLDAFRVGAGTLLFLSGIGLVHGRGGGATEPEAGGVAVVPLAIPIIVGPATVGILLVKGAELTEFSERMLGCLAMLTAVGCVGIFLLAAEWIQRLLGARGISVLSRLTGLILAAIAAQMIMTGVKGFFGPGL